MNLQSSSRDSKPVVGSSYPSEVRLRSLLSRSRRLLTPMLAMMAVMIGSLPKATAANPPRYDLVESSLTGVQSLTNARTVLRGRFASAPGGEARGGPYQLQALARPIMVVPGAHAAPEIRIVFATPTSLRVEWPPEAADFQLESTDDVAVNPWTPVAPPGNTSIELPIELGPRFYRLRKMPRSP